MSHQALAVVLVVSCLLAPASAAISSMLAGDAEDDVSACSRRNSELSCLLGCFKCAVAFGRKTYNMGGCCTECHKSGAMLVDDGPEYCSPRFFTDMFASKAHYVNAPSVLSPMANRQARTRTRRYHQS